MNASRFVVAAAVLAVMTVPAAQAQTPCTWQDSYNYYGLPAVGIKCNQAQSHGGVGIGTLVPSPGMLLHLKGDPGWSAFALFDRGSNGADGGYLFRTADTQATQFFFGKLGPLYTESLAIAYGATMTPYMVVTPGGTVGIGIAHPNAQMKLDVAGDASISGNLTAGNFAAKYQDVAEWVPATADLAPGTVVVLSRERANEVTIAATEYDTAVAGVVSPEPGLILGEAGNGKEMVATTGRVKVKVDATRRPVAIGDLLVTSSRPGFAMASEPMELNGRKFHQPGTIIGKALEALPGGDGEILVLLSMQ